MSKILDRFALIAFGSIKVDIGEIVANSLINDLFNFSSNSMVSMIQNIFQKSLTVKNIFIHSY
ncbi:MAG: hypothetical protein A2202_00690 [Bdellovibrionales bacterium RIFOXYA1_FULL_36_14]|nr:MAG: hypothetical protein A2202_00690 [Bdellovibrionales bacterium RIFOXYA1_FULL_36_14]